MNDAPSFGESPRGLEDDPFFPVEPTATDRLGLSAVFVEHLLVKLLADRPGATGGELADAATLNPALARRRLQDLKQRMLVQHAQAEARGDFHYDLTQAGRQLAAELRRQSPYSGPAPVTMEAWRESIWVQSITNEKPRPADLRRALSDLVLPEEIFELVGPALCSGKGLFLFGPPGNGKTSLAMRLGKAWRNAVYVPHAVLMEGRVVQVFDPQVHQPSPLPERSPFDAPRVDRRWVRCRRPVVVAGGELTMSSLELSGGEDGGALEAPLQVKASCGVLVIDDFGRQRIDPATLLNRWILPLENRVDYLRLPGGRKVEVPFDPLLVFSTNLDPSDLVDEAFLRRIPYKVQVGDPGPEAFRELLRREAEGMGFPPDEAALEMLVERCFGSGRPMRCCHARDLLLQVRNRCLYRSEPMELSSEAVDLAVRAYFTLLS